MIRLCIVISIVLIFLGCGSEVADTGSGSGLGNPVIIGIASNLDGTPLQNGKVTVRPLGYIAGESLKGMFGAGFDSNGVLVTDTEGKYQGELLFQGDWVVEIATSTSTHAVTMVVHLDDSTEIIPRLTVTELDTIHGKVTFHGGAVSGCTISRFGSDQVVVAKSDGLYSMAVPVGSHSLQFTPESDAYNTRVVENTAVRVEQPVVRILAKKPVSKDWICDSLIVRAILDSNKFTLVPVTAVIEKSANRVAKLDIDNTLHYFNNSAVFDTLLEMVTGLTALTEMELQLTAIRSLPDNFGDLVNIKELELDYNQLTTLPASIVKIKPYEECSFTGNRIASLPADIAAWATKYDPDWQKMQMTK